MDETKSLTQQAQEMHDKELNERKVRMILSAMQQKERNNKVIADYTKKNAELDTLISKVEAGDPEALEQLHNY